MKTKAIIIVGLLLALTLAFCSITHAQGRDKCPSIVNSDSTRVLIADETWLFRLKTGTKIECFNESVFNDLIKSHGTLFKRFTCTWKTDRYGRYKEYVIYLSEGDAQLIVNWAKTNL
jgi:L-fucose isomerase-like protein